MRPELRARLALRWANWWLSSPRIDRVRQFVYRKEADHA